MTQYLDCSPYNPAWTVVFEQEALAIQGVLQESCLAVHHVGSTSVPGLAAKPKIDIIAVIRPQAEVRHGLDHLGYTHT
jgi:GrpB-like predicted nucleotidyltransferase (UPF0157 family)